MKINPCFIALIASFVATTATADDYPYRVRGYWWGNNVAGRTYCSNSDLTAFQRSDGSNLTIKIAAREKITFGWAGDLTIKILSVGVNISIETPGGGVLTFVDDSARPDRTGTYSQTGSRLDIVLDGGDLDEDIVTNWYASGDGSMIHGSATQRFSSEEPDVRQGRTWSWTLIEGSDCVAEAAFGPFD